MVNLEKDLITDSYYNHITMSDVIGRCYYCKDGWKEMTEEQRDRYFNKMKWWLVEQTSRGSKLREELEETRPLYVQDCGILRRLWVDTRDDRVVYCAGQDYRVEMNTVKRVVAGRRVR